MSIIEIILHCLIYTISFSNALQCTTDCFIFLDFNSPLEIPSHCNQTASAKQCKVDLSISYNYNSIYISLFADTFSSSLGDNHFAMTQVSADGSITVSYSIARYCKKKDDCARDLARQSLLEILQRPLINTQSLGNELIPLLSSNLSTKNIDLICFDQKENVRQCGIASKSGACDISQQLIGKQSTVRSCNNNLYSQSQFITIFDSEKFSSFTLECNRSLCNGPMTLQVVKEILLKYNLTKTIDGRLNNNGIRRSIFSLWMIFFVLFFFEK